MSLTKNQREELRNLFGGRCAYCGKPLEKVFHADHVDPIFRGWSRGSVKAAGRICAHDSQENLFPACPRCNHMKATYTVNDFRLLLYFQVEQLKKYDNRFRAALDYGTVKETGADIVFWFEKYDKPTSVLAEIKKGAKE